LNFEFYLVLTLICASLVSYTLSVFIEKFPDMLFVHNHNRLFNCFY